MTISTTYQCDRCRDVLIQGIALEARFFGERLGRRGLGVVHDVEIPAEGLHFCDTDCLENYLKSQSGY